MRSPAALLTWKIARAWRIFKRVANYPSVYSHLVLKTPLRELRLPDGIHISTTEGIELWRLFHDIWLSEIYTREFNPITHDSVVVDIGASIGVFSLYAASLGGSVFASEPDLASFECLLDNIRMNPDLRIRGRRIAVSGSHDRRLLHHPARRTGSSFYPFKEQKATTSAESWVECMTLEEFFAESSIRTCDFLKMNCEGAEYEIVFSTPKEVLSLISAMVIECHDNTPYRSIDLMKFLDSAGFEVSLDVARTDGTSILLARQKQRTTRHDSSSQ